MFIAMNRFKVRKDEEAAFEDRWRERDTHLHTVAGFVEFHLLKAGARRLRALRLAYAMAIARRFRGVDAVRSVSRPHRNAGTGRPLTISHPEFEGFEVIQVVRPHTAAAAAQ